MNHCPMDKLPPAAHMFSLLWLEIPMENFDWQDPRHSIITLLQVKEPRSKLP